MLAQYVSIDEIERKALDILPKSVRDYYASGADEELTLDRNKSAYRRYALILQNPSLLDSLFVPELPLKCSSLFLRLKCVFFRLLIRPKVFHDVKLLDTSVRLNIPMNKEKVFPYPIGIAPTAFHRMAHPEGELATCRGK